MSNLNNPDPRPAVGSEPATAGVEFTNLNLLAGGWFTPTTYRGAFDPTRARNQQWDAGWTNYNPQNTNYTTDVRQESNVAPNAFTLEQNYPNPFNPSTTIRFTLPTAARVQIAVYNVLGEEVATVVDEEMAAGTFTTTFDAGNLSSGIYVYTLKTNTGFSQARKMLLVR
jgi:hypothetical protein